MEWNNTAIMDFEECGERGRRKHIEKEHRPRTVPLVRGIAFHTTSKRVYMRKLKTLEWPTVDEVRELAAGDFEAEWLRDEVRVDDDDIDELGTSSVRGETKDLVIALAAHDRIEVAPSIVPVAVEHKVVVKPADSDLVIHGTMDLVHDAGAGDVIIDKKTGTKAPNRNAAHDSQQFDMYGLLRLGETGRLPIGYRQDHIYRTPARKDLKTVLLDTTRTREHLDTMVRRINVVADAVAKGVFMPSSPSHWRCSEKWCEYWNDCPYAKRGLRPQS